MTQAIDGRDSLLNALRTGTVPAVAIKQPWANLILHDGKDIENRRWTTSHRGWTLVHASKEPDHPAMAAFVSVDDLHPIPQGAFGGIVGAVKITGICRASPSRWFDGPIGWMLAAPIPLPHIVPCRGLQGLFTPPPTVIAQVIEGFSV